jgi:hypothetical protein
MTDPPRRPRPEARRLLDVYVNSDSVKERDEAWIGLAELANRATELLKATVEVHHLRVLIALAQLTPPAQVNDDTPEEEAPTQPSVEALAGYGQSFVSDLLGDLVDKLGLVRHLKRPHDHLHPPHRGRDMYWLTPAGDRLLTKLSPERKWAAGQPLTLRGSHPVP